MIDLRAFAIIDRLQRQFVGFIGSTALGYYPVAGQSAFFVEIAPGIEINSITNVVLKRATGSPLRAIDDSERLLALNFDVVTPSAGYLAASSV